MVDTNPATEGVRPKEQDREERDQENHSVASVSPEEKEVEGVGLGGNQQDWVAALANHTTLARVGPWVNTEKLLAAGHCWCDGGGQGLPLPVGQPGAGMAATRIGKGLNFPMHPAAIAGGGPHQQVWVDFLGPSPFTHAPTATC